MSVELKVTLVGEDPQQQAAFNNPQSVSPSSAAPVPDSSGMPREHFPRIEHRPLPQPQQPAQSTQAQQSQQQIAPSPTAQPSQPATQQQVSTSQPIATDQRLINTLEQLIQSIDALTASNTSQSTQSTGSAASSSGHNRNHHSTNQSFFERIAESINRKIDEMGLAHTAVGDLVTGSAGRFADLATRATKFAGSAFGTRSAGTAASAAAAAGTGTAAAASGTSGAAAAAGGAAASGAAGTGAGAAATGALAGASGPLLAVALAAGAAALSLKMFMDAVKRTATDLADLSPEITGERSKHEINMELAKLDRAKRIGGDVAGIDAAQNRLSEAMYKLSTDIKEILYKGAPIAEAVINGIASGVEKVEHFTEYAAIQAEVTRSAFAAEVAKLTESKEDDKEAAKNLADATKRLHDFMNDKDGEKKGQIDPMFQAILDADIIANPKRGQQP